MHSPRHIARRRLDARLRRARELTSLTVPPRGWIRAIRTSLGMSTTELGRRMGVDQSRVVRIEQAEANGTLRLDTMQRAAAALGCRFVYALVPDVPLEDMVHQQALDKARSELAPVVHSMALEDQRPDDAVLREHVDELAGDLVDKRGLWS